MELGLWRFGGVAFMLVGCALYTASALAFLTEGGGTPAIWFSKPLRRLIGEEPMRLVRGATYHFTRNPMYLGIVTFIVGQAILFETEVVLMYAGVVWLCFHLVVVLAEEPHLRKKSGEAYVEYCRRVPRWIGFRRHSRDTLSRQ
ncbi:MAG TPA: isoprenylcysteine carboxylmethyltransferase family protein [Bacteroidota bacterium]|nr:isoprenylcysteine carboxylmethyltransferase family protein [Bacteroidota bacterium]